MPTAKANNRTSRTTRTSRRRATGKHLTAPRSAEVAVEGGEPLSDVLDAEVRVRVSGASSVAVAILIVLVILTAASINWLYAIVAIAGATSAGWLLARGRA
jgi:hypothetical protein